MPIKKSSVKLPKTSKKTSEHTPLGKSIIQGMKEMQEWSRGKLELRTRVVYVPEEVDVHAIREKAGLSQSQFADRYGFNPRTLQDWEQGRTRPDGAVRAYLTVIARNPNAVDRALRHG